MKSTGIVRKVDNLGRIVLPVELRRTLGIDIHSDVEIYVTMRKILLFHRLANWVLSMICGNALCH